MWRPDPTLKNGAFSEKPQSRNKTYNQMKIKNLIPILGALFIGLTSPTIGKAQTDKYPPIQSYFDKTVDQKCSGVWGLDKIISQQITENSITEISETVHGDLYKSVYSNLDFSKLDRISTYEEDYGSKKIICLAFWFSYDITYTLYKNGEQFANGAEDRFHCYILAKDEKAIIALFNAWIK